MGLSKFLTYACAVSAALALGCGSVAFARPACENFFGQNFKPRAPQVAFNQHAGQSEFFRSAAQLTGAEDFAKREYGEPFASSAINRLRELGPQFPVVLTDLAIASRLEKFVQFVKEKNLQDEEPWVAVERFRKFSGKRVVYRALSLTDEEAQTMIKTGMDSNFLRLRSTRQTRTQSFKRLLNFGFLNILNARFEAKRRRENDFYLSVSDHPQIAASVAGLFHRNQNPKIFVFEIEVSEADLIKLGSREPFIYPERVRDLIAKNLGGEVVMPNGQKETFAFGPEVERFLAYRVKPGAIKGVYEMPAAEAPTYNTVFGKPSAVVQTDAEFLQKYSRKLN